ncbi:MAG TPA: hypothetical protein VL049_28320 [Candidatus Dormibacteraeota bacterium]|nr:hypothetical protein [Candidatus Dormibacteraeota bacterium]
MEGAEQQPEQPREGEDHGDLEDQDEEQTVEVGGGHMVNGRGVNPGVYRRPPTLKQ